MLSLSQEAIRLLKEAVDECKDIKAPSLGGEEYRRRLRAVQELEDAGLIRRRGQGLYMVTRKGILYRERCIPH